MTLSQEPSPKGEGYIRTHFSVEDTGIGIREEDLPRIFEKGFTGYNGRAGQKSTGIGLYLCRRVSEQLNHDLTIVSRPGQGTIARLDLSRKARTME